MSKKPSKNQSAFDPEMMAAFTKELPNVLVKEGYLTSPSAVESSQKESIQSSTASTSIQKQNSDHFASMRPRENRNHLWVWVSIFVVLIIGIWIFNIKNIASDLWGNRGDAGKILDQSKTDFQDILSTIKKNDLDLQKRFQGLDIASGASLTTSSIADALKAAIESKQP